MISPAQHAAFPLDITCGGSRPCSATWSLHPEPTGNVNLPASDALSMRTLQVKKGRTKNPINQNPKYNNIILHSQIQYLLILTKILLLVEKSKYNTTVATNYRRLNKC